MTSVILGKKNAVPCLALSNNNAFVISASGGKISLFRLADFVSCSTFMSPPPAVITELKGHQNRVTGVAFSNVLNVLVSSGADSQLCVWNTDGWEKQTSKFLQIPPGRGVASHVDTHVQFHQDQIHLLAVDETRIAIYKAPKLECLKQWVPHEACGPITHATYSCDSQSIYVSFQDGSIGVFTASSLRLRCRINPASYLPADMSPRVHPLVIAAHPSDPNQFALGVSDGGVCALEPLESDREGSTNRLFFIVNHEYIEAALGVCTS